MKKLRPIFCAIVLIYMPFFLNAQTTKQDSIWKPFKNFIGKWGGMNEGQMANGKYERTYQFIFNGKFIEVKNKSIYPPTAKNPKGEVHEDLGYISYDKARKTFILRQFHIEGFVNQYKMDSISPDKKYIVFNSENIENIPAGFRARETYILVNDNEFIESFDLAEPNGKFEVYSKARLIKQ